MGALIFQQCSQFMYSHMDGKLVQLSSKISYVEWTINSIKAQYRGGIAMTSA